MKERRMMEGWIDGGWMDGWMKQKKDDGRVDGWMDDR